jgi:hypothetical protein
MEVIGCCKTELWLLSGIMNLLQFCLFLAFLQLLVLLLKCPLEKGTHEFLVLLNSGLRLWEMAFSDLPSNGMKSLTSYFMEWDSVEWDFVLHYIHSLILYFVHGGMGCSILPFIWILYLGWAVPMLHKRDGRDNTEYTPDVEGIINGNQYGGWQQNKVFVLGGRPSSKYHLILLQYFHLENLQSDIYVIEPPASLLTTIKCYTLILMFNKWMALLFQHCYCLLLHQS